MFFLFVAAGELKRGRLITLTKDQYSDLERN